MTFKAILLFAVFRNGCFSLDCYMGDNMSDKMTEFSTRKCDTSHYILPLKPRPNRIDNTVLRDNSTSNLNITFSNVKSNITHCLVFKYYGRTPDGKRSANFHGPNKIDFSCDHDDMCSTSARQGVYFTRVDYKGDVGSLYCCAYDLCNSLNVSLDSLMPSPRQTCQSGQSSNLVEVDFCFNTTYCVNETFLGFPRETISSKKTISSAGHVTYGCDVNGLCKTISAANGSCLTLPNADGIGKRIVCCCSSSMCNAAVTTTAAPCLVSGAATSAPLMTINMPFISGTDMPMPPVYATVEKSPTFYAVTIVGSLGLFACATVIVVIVTKAIRKRRNAQVTYSYNQLTSDLTSDNITEDERLLIG